MTEEILNVMESVGQSKTGMVRVRDNLSPLMNHLHTFVIIVNAFQKVLHCACAIKIPVISQFPTPTGSILKKSLISIKSHLIA
jgi:hypothetical protein